MKKLIIATAALVMASCASTYKPMYSVNEVLLVNNSREILREVSVTVPNTGRSFSCGNVAPFGICGTRLPARRYESNPIQVEWTFGNRSRSSDEFVVPVPATFATGKPLRAVLAVSEDGAMSAYFEQESSLK